ncbi:protein kinase domain-containing protein [Gemmatimonas sp.]|uniref:RCC1 domain-containing protein n=1 Tax=Gemmatimonas sp. TaxID=1962908 RepID=UPI0035665410
MSDEMADDVVSDLDEYTLLGELGRGGSAIVYRARDRDLFREVAIKVVRPRFAAQADEAIERLAREARTVARLQHPNIVTVHAVKRLRDGGLALVMQLVPGRTLKQAIQEDGPFSPERAERVLKDIAEALAFAHAHGVVHRDVKPENVFLDVDTDRALLSDFGIAHSAEFDSRLTMTGAAIGTPAYMAPEQIDGGPANARSDVYSLGLVTWEMLTGVRPWEGEALYNVIFKQKNEELPAIDAVRPGEVPPRLQYITERMLQKKPAARWAGADGLLVALDAWVVPSDWRQWEESHRRRREREKAKPRVAPVPKNASADATVRFARPTDTGAPAATTLVPTPATPAAWLPTPSVATNADDEAPSWASDSAPSQTRRWWIVAALTVSAAGAAFAYSATHQDAVPVRRAPPAVMADAGNVELAIVARTDSSPGIVPITSVDSSPITGATDTPASMAPSNLSRDTFVADSIAGMRVWRAERLVARNTARVADSTARAGTPAAPVVAPTVRATDDPGVIAAGGRHSCALVSVKVLCWGANERGQLGDGDAEARSTPAPVVGELSFTQVSTGLAHSCGVARGGEAYCWGNDDKGQLGDATFTSRSAPVRVSGNQSFRVVRAGLTHTCGLTSAGEVLCWGSNANGQLGDGTTATRSSPTLVSGGLRFVSLSAGWNHSCAIATDGVAYCWGANASGQIGNGTRADVRTPIAVSGATRLTSISAGGSHTCAVEDTGEAFCWGRNSFGQLGLGGTTDQLTPTLVGGSTRFISVTLGGVHSCGRTRAGQAWCWGRNVYGQLGDGTNASREVPTRALGGITFAALNATGAHTCGMAGDGELWCWGFNVEGQLGDGTRNHLARPTRVMMTER